MKKEGGMMSTKVWQAEGVRNHLLAVQAGVRAGVPATLRPDDDGRLTAYLQGSDAALKCLAERFGVYVDGVQPVRRPQTGELRLKTWTREDIERNLMVAWVMMCDNLPLSQEPDARLVAYYNGIRKTLLFLAMSFNIEGFSLPSGNGSPGEGHE
jgi:hypothetical protein